MTRLEIVFLLAVALGVLTEGAALGLKLWRYRNPLLPLLNILLMFGVVQGVCLAGFVGAQVPLLSIAPVLLMAGALVGLAYEGANHFWLQAWTWSAAPLVGLSQPIDKAALVGASWGMVPVTIVALERIVP